MKGYANFVIAQRKLIIGLIILVSLCFALNLLTLRVNSSPYFMAQEHESRIHELDIKQLFTNSGEQILVALKPHSGNPLDLTTVALVRSLTHQFEALTLTERIDTRTLDPLRFNREASIIVDRLMSAATHERAALVRQLRQLADQSQQGSNQIEPAIANVEYLLQPIIKVRSFASLENLTSNADELDIHPLLPEGELTNDMLERFQKELRDNPLFRGLLISDDEKVTTIQIEMSIPKDDNRNTVKLYEKVVEIVEKTDYAGQIFLAGNPVIDAQMAKSMERDNLVFFPFVLLLVSLILYLGFRTWSGVYVPLTIAGVTTLWTMGLMAALGIDQNIVTTILPVFLLTVAVADAIHFYSCFVSKELQHQSLSERLSYTLSTLSRPLVLTSITTLIGFIALAWTDIIFIYEFGLLMSAGVVFALIITFLLAPVLVLNVNVGSSKPQSIRNKFLENQLIGLVSAVLAHPLKALTLALVCLLGSGYALQFLRFEQENINNFAPDTVLRAHNTAMLEHFKGTIPIDIWIDTGQPGGIYEPELIRGIKRLETYLQSRQDIGYVLTPVDFLERMYDLLTHNGHQLPEGFDRQLIAQEILVYENENSQDIKHVIDDQHRHARLIVLGKSDAASFWGPILADIEARTPTGSQLEISGYGKVMFTNIEAVIKTNISSTVIALSLIALVMIVLFKSVTTGVIAVFPLVLTVLMNYACMSALGVAVDVGTTIIASIAFGIGIDYSIHFLAAIERKVKAGEKDLRKIMHATTRQVGLPIVINSLTLAVGFLVLLASNFLVLQLLGLFIAMTMLISAFNALVLIPLLYYLWHRKTTRFSEELAPPSAG